MGRQHFLSKQLGSKACSLEHHTLDVLLPLAYLEEWVFGLVVKPRVGMPAFHAGGPGLEPLALFLILALC